MRKFVALAIGVALQGFCLEMTPPESPKNSKFYFTPDLFVDHYKYSYMVQTSEGELVQTKIKGNNFYYGSHFGYEYASEGSIYSSTDFLLATSNPSYWEEYTWIRLEQKIGHSFLQGSSHLVPYTGAGWRGEEYTYGGDFLKSLFGEFYALAGLEYLYAVDSRWSLGLDLKGMYAFVRKVYSKRQAYNDVPEESRTSTIQDALGFSFALPIQWTPDLERTFVLEVRPYIERADFSMLNNYLVGLSGSLGWRF